MAKGAQTGCRASTPRDTQNPAGSGPEYSLSRSSCGKGTELDNLPEVPSYLHYPLILWCLLACLHCWSSYTAWRPYTATGEMASSPYLRHHFDPHCLSALLTIWSTAIPKELLFLYFTKSIKYFQILNGRLQAASCSQTTPDTDSLLLDLSKTMSLLLQCTLSTP